MPTPPSRFCQTSDSLLSRVYKFTVYALLSCAVLPTSAVAASQSMADALITLAPTANPQVLKLAADAMSCAEQRGQPLAERLAVIDYSRPSSQPRLWVFDLAKQRLLFKELVAHGRGTGGEQARYFSNVTNSHKSSLGLFRTLAPYQGKNGYSLRLEGLEPGVNDHAFSRAIVIHGADYVSKKFINSAGRLGRSLGCPAVRRQVAKPLIDSIKHDQYLFAYYPDPTWLKRSAYLGCTPSLQNTFASAATGMPYQGTQP
ncbi:murein L,D-transpeptidase catalytic domain family protein [Phytohalomonas tamaricis]|uniref:murein L,D-transpeptidase catalytic domain family protein n=1 Tax=Phytohalomonas tamaricis TaxID=2081032 RepID=UPI000D0B89E4|nr:murein L,D-transpeptidase catalytic domain family protein [Phytohalomonas tamaricis]